MIFTERMSIFHFFIFITTWFSRLLKKINRVTPLLFFKFSDLSNEKVKTSIGNLENMKFASIFVKLLICHNWFSKSDSCCLQRECQIRYNGTSTANWRATMTRDTWRFRALWSGRRSCWKAAREAFVTVRLLLRVEGWACEFGFWDEEVVSTVFTFQQWPCQLLGWIKMSITTFRRNQQCGKPGLKWMYRNGTSDFFCSLREGQDEKKINRTMGTECANKIFFDCEPAAGMPLSLRHEVCRWRLPYFSQRPKTPKPTGRCRAPFAMKGVFGEYNVFR